MLGQFAFAFDIRFNSHWSLALLVLMSLRSRNNNNSFNIDRSNFEMFPSQLKKQHLPPHKVVVDIQHQTRCEHARPRRISTSSSNLWEFLSDF
jgi:hypothetical protein